MGEMEREREGKRRRRRPPPEEGAKRGEASALRQNCGTGGLC